MESFVFTILQILFAAWMLTFQSKIMNKQVPLLLLQMHRTFPTSLNFQRKTFFCIEHKTLKLDISHF